MTGTVIAALGLVIAAGAFTLNFQSLSKVAQQVELSRLSLVAVQRAFIARKTVDTVDFPAYLSLTPRWINDGNTQAVNARNRTGCQELGTFNTGLGFVSAIHLAPKQEALGEDCELSRTNPNWHRSRQIVLWISVRYDDVFGGRHTTSECGIYEIPPEPTASMRFDARACSGRWAELNCVDGECAGDAFRW